MRIKIMPPHAMTIRGLTINPDDGAIEFELAYLRRQSDAVVGYIQATGLGGRESKAILHHSGQTGKFGVVNIVATPDVPVFDLPPTGPEDGKPSSQESQRK